MKNVLNNESKKFKST